MLQNHIGDAVLRLIDLDVNVQNWIVPYHNVRVVQGKYHQQSV